MANRVSDKQNTQGAPTVDEVRARIDSGETGDKVDYPDPAAAPLGTDDEAAGNSPTARRRRMALPPDAPTPEEPAWKKSLVWIAPAFVILIICALAFALTQTT